MEVARGLRWDNGWSLRADEESWAHKRMRWREMGCAPGQKRGNGRACRVWVVGSRRWMRQAPRGGCVGGS